MLPPDTGKMTPTKKSHTNVQEMKSHQQSALKPGF